MIFFCQISSYKFYYQFLEDSLPKIHTFQISQIQLSCNQYNIYNNKKIKPQKQIRKSSNPMIQFYNMLRQTYIIDGFQPAQQYIEYLEQNKNLPELCLINFYCYINIQSKNKMQETLQILNNCLLSPDCNGSILALTLYHRASIFFQNGQYNQCRNVCQDIIQKFIGLYYSMEMRLDKTQEEKVLSHELQELIYYVFLMLAYVSRQQNRFNDSNVLYEAGRRIIKDRQDVLSLTTKTSAIKTEGEQEQQLFSPQTTVMKKSSQKQNKNARDRPGIKQTKSMSTF